MKMLLLFVIVLSFSCPAQKIIPVNFIAIVDTGAQFGELFPLMSLNIEGQQLFSIIKAQIKEKRKLVGISVYEEEKDWPMIMCKRLDGDTASQEEIITYLVTKMNKIDKVEIYFYLLDRNREEF